MYGNATAVGLMIVCAIVALTVGILQRRLAYRQTSHELGYMSLASASGIAAAASSVMYFAYFRSPTTVTLIAGDVAMVLAPAFLWAALLRLSGRPLSRVAVAIVGPIIVGAYTALAAQPASIAAKVVALAVYCTLIVMATSLPSMKRRPGIRLIRVASAAYALYCVLRLIALFGLGTTSVLYSTFFTIGPTTLASAVAVILIAAGSLILSGAVRHPNSLPAPPEGDAVHVRIEIVDRELIRAAAGAEAVDALTRSLIAIVARHSHIVNIHRDGITASVPAAELETVSSAIGEQYDAEAKPRTGLPVNLLRIRPLQAGADATESRTPAAGKRSS